MTENNVPSIPPLSPHYEAATEDSGIVIRFVGNTPMIEGISLIKASPFHLFAAIKFLEFQANKMLVMEEARQMQNRIAVGSPAMKMPPAPGAK